jgi:serine/threonine protein kinase
MQGNVACGYEVGGVIGIGTFGEVRHGKALDQMKDVTRQHVALKIIDVSRFSSEINLVLVKEVQFLQMLGHERCAKIFEVHENVPYKGMWCDSCACTDFSCSKDDDFMCAHCPHSSQQHSGLEARSVLVIVLELGAGGEIFSLLMHSGAFPEDIVRYYFQQLIFGLEYVHSKSISHRDLKPENLVLDADFNLKIVDFGLAALATDVQVCGGLMYSGVGSLPYSAPEVYYSKELFRGMGYKGAPADVWSCGVILFVLLTGRPPFARPLTKTYGKNLKRCKHYCRLTKGLGYEGISANAKHLLMQIFQQNPEARLTLHDIKHHPWFNGPLPDPGAREKVMEQKAMEVWHFQRKGHMAELLNMLRAARPDRVAPSPILSPLGNTFGGDVRWLGMDPLPSPSSSSFQSPATPIMFTPHGGVSSFVRPLPPEFQLPPQATITEEEVSMDEEARNPVCRPLYGSLASSPLSARPLAFPWGSHTTVTLHPMLQTTDQFDAMSFADELDHEEKKKLH